MAKKLDASCHLCGDTIGITSGQYIYCGQLKKRIPLTPDETPHNRNVINGRAMKVISRTADHVPVYGPDPDDRRFRVTDTGAWYFVPEKCPNGGGK